MFAGKPLFIGKLFILNQYLMLDLKQTFIDKAWHPSSGPSLLRYFSHCLSVHHSWKTRWSISFYMWTNQATLLIMWSWISTSTITCFWHSCHSLLLTHLGAAFLYFITTYTLHVSEMMTNKRLVSVYHVILLKRHLYRVKETIVISSKCVYFLSVNLTL